jgi:hypothetical protein
MVFWFKNKIVRWNFLLSLLLNFLTWIFLYWQVTPQTEPVSLRYNIYFGVNLIGEWWQVFWLPLFGLVFLIINYILTLAFIKKERVPAYFLTYGTTLLQILVAVLAVFTVLING